MSTTVDILIPTYRRPSALAVTLTSLVSQTYRDFRIVISDQTEDSNPAKLRRLRLYSAFSALTVMLSKSTNTCLAEIAEQRQFLLDQAMAPYCLFLDDDLILESDVIERMLTAIQEESCGFVGSAVIGLSFIDDVRPHEQKIEFWDSPVQPELVQPDTPQWERWRLHNAANIYHIQQRFGITPNQQRKYRVAWIAGCVMYGTSKLREIGGFSFWQELPVEHCGEDVLVQLRLMERYGGCGIVPSGAYHQELPTTIVDRSVPADRVLKATPVIS